jgi:hypothetical protein
MSSVAFGQCQEAAAIKMAYTIAQSALFSENIFFRDCLFSKGWSILSKRHCRLKMASSVLITFSVSSPKLAMLMTLITLCRFVTCKAHVKLFLCVSTT